MRQQDTKKKKQGRGAVRRPKPFTEAEPRVLGWQNYREANVLEEILSDEATPDDVRKALTDAVTEFSNRSGVDVLHPRVVRDAYIEMIRCGTKESRDAERNLESLLRHCGVYDDETGRTHGSSVSLRFEQTRARVFAEVLGVHKDEEATKPRKRKRRARRSFGGDFAEVKITSANRSHVDELKYGLTAWVSFLLDISPDFIPHLYTAVTDQWCDRVRGVVYDQDGSDHRDRKSVRLHGVVLDALARARGEERVSEEMLPMRRRERGNALADAESLFLQLAKHAERLRCGVSDDAVLEVVNAPVADYAEPQTTGDDEPVDLNLWRQVHPRPIKSCAVSVTEVDHD